MKELISETTQLVEGIQSKSAELTSKTEKLISDINQGMLGPKGSQIKQEELREEKNRYQWEIRKKVDDLLEKIDEAEQKALEKIELNAEPVTADSVAELQLLKGLDTTAEELQRYATKYHNNPLAIKTLRQIAKNKNIMTTFPETEQEKIINKYKKLKTVVKTYNNFNVNAVGYKKIVQDTTLELQADSLKEF